MEVRDVKKRGSLSTFIAVVAALAAAAAIIGANIDRILESLDTLKKTAKDAAFRSEDESDFEVVEL
jgi:hypothetical protein